MISAQRGLKIFKASYIKIIWIYVPILNSFDNLQGAYLNL